MFSWRSLFELPPEKRRSHRIHLIGVGGTGLAPIAKVLLEMGFQVSGSDQAASARTRHIARLGAAVRIGHDVQALMSERTPNMPDLVLASSAIPDTNPEAEAARAAGIPVVNRAALLGPLTNGRDVIAVAGTHGKTTTTGMIALLLEKAGLQPGYIIGSDVPGLGISSAGASRWFVIEADEYDYAFLGLNPTIAVLTSLEWDHPDCFPTRAAYEDAFHRFLANTTPSGHVVYCRDDPRLEALSANSAGAQWHGYGARNGAPWKISGIDITPGGASFVITPPAGQPTPVRLATPGLHNVLNSAGALAAASLAGVAVEQAATWIGEYKGAGRRFEIKGEAGGVLVIDDYAHHPTEIRTTLAAARAAYPDRDIWAVYQPHTYSRTRTFISDFEGVFSAADHLIITDIFAAREAPDPTVTPQSVAAISRHPDSRAIASLDDVLAFLAAHVRPGALVIILSAGTATTLGPRLLERLRTPEMATRSV